MKKIINGKVYDTDTARKLGSYENMADYRNFHYFCEALYQKRTGEYFLHGEGGPMTQYARTIDQNSWSGGEKIMPMSVEAARKWAEEHLDADDYAEAFGMPDEDDTELTTLCIQIPAILAVTIKRMAAEQGTSLRAVVTGILEKNCK